MTDDGAALLRAVCEHPADDVVRLAFADRLDEHGEASRAEFVRLQVEWHRVMCWHVPHNGGTSTGPDPAKRRRDRLSELRRREKELWPLVRESYRAAVGAGWAVHAEGCVPRVEDERCPAAVVRRGFVAEVRAPLQVLFGRTGGCFTNEPSPSGCDDCGGTGHVPGIAADLFARHPVTAVVVPGLEPWEDVDEPTDEHGWCWWRWSSWGNSHSERNRLGNLPDDVFDVMARLYPGCRLCWGGGHTNQHIGFPTRQAALDAVSAAAVLLGRSLAGLPPLP